MFSAYQDDFKSTLDKVLRMKPVQEMGSSRNIRYIHHDWVNAGCYIHFKMILWVGSSFGTGESFFSGSERGRRPFGLYWLIRPMRQ